MSFTLIRDDSVNVKAFATRAEALAAVRMVIDARGVEGVNGLGLAHSPSSGDLRVIAEDAELARLAVAAPRGRRRAT